MSEGKMTVKEAKLESIIDYCLTNPTHSVQEVAAAFGVSSSWMYAVTNSDLFQARLSEAREQVREVIVHTVGDKLTGALSLSLDRLSEKLESIESPEYILQAVEVLSKRHVDLKMDRGHVMAFQQNNFFANPDALKALQAKALSQAHQPPPALQHADVSSASDD